jgi:hypothetical protein
MGQNIAVSGPLLAPPQDDAERETDSAHAQAEAAFSGATPAPPGAGVEDDTAL